MPVSSATLADASEAQCFHCGEENPPGARWTADIDGAERAFCCAGCRAVAQTIRAAGLVDFYARRARGMVDGVAARDVAIDDVAAGDAQTIAIDAGTREVALLVEGLRCGACIWLIERWLAREPGVVLARVNLATRRARVRFAPAATGVAAILRAFAAIGYRAHPYDPARREALARKESRVLLRRTALALLGMMQVMMFAVPAYVSADGVDPEYASLMNWASLLLALPVVAYAGAPFFTGALADLRARRLGMDVPIALGAGAAFLASAWATIAGAGAVYFDSVTMFVALVLGARWLELRIRERAGDTLEAIAREVPVTALRLRGYPGSTDAEVVPARMLSAGDVVRVATGAPVPADGEVVEGRSRVEEALLTGESRAVAKARGDRVLAGSVNGESPLVVRVVAAGEATALAAVARLAERAADARPRIARFADRTAAWFVAGLLVVAAAAAVAWSAIDAARALPIAIAVLVVSCPCALSLATPAALASAAGALARRGVLCVRPDALEALSRVTHVVLDKTGTLTTGDLRLLATDPAPGASASRCGAIAAALERGAHHPIARAFDDVPGERLVAHDVVAMPGLGVEGTVDGVRYRLGRADWVGAPPTGSPRGDETRVTLAAGDRVLATFRLGDRLRHDAARVVAMLRNSGIGTSIVSGDDPAVVSQVAARVGIRDFRGGASPADKQARVADLQRRGHVVAMVGDGINDAPGLARADVSLAFGDAAALTRWTADIVVPGEASDIALALDVARRTFRVIRQNLAWALAYNAVAIPLAALGLLSPLAAAAGMSASSLAVVANAARLARLRTHDEARASCAPDLALPAATPAR